ncbi:hypothetical protein H5410_039982 [Solanum commersonii]|uniref:Uncharacterized protein n=1 Tax=Solanum commersonii TaxID=4109 RepID=A0A9J5XQ32_SOLCO|nr:hypothetical protein H5410_039982 [Solanum commersonii]
MLRSFMISSPWSLLHIFLFLGVYMQDYCLNFASTSQGSLRRWWSDQRMWIIRGLSSFPVGIIEYLMKRMGIVTQKFNVTSKVVDHDQVTR